MTPARWHPGQLALLWLIVLSAAAWIAVRLPNPFVIVHDEARLVIGALVIATVCLLIITWRWFAARQARRDIMQQAVLERIRRG